MNYTYFTRIAALTAALTLVGISSWAEDLVPSTSLGSSHDLIPSTDLTTNAKNSDAITSITLNDTIKPTGDGSLHNFPSRHVTILIPTANTALSKSLEGYLINQLKATLRYPYYDTKTEPNLLASTPLNPDALGAISKQMGADILLIPVVERDSYQSYHPTYFGHRLGGIFSDYDDDDEIYVRANTAIRILYYDAQRNMMSSSSGAYYRTDESLSMPSHVEVWRIVTEETLNKLPYKRLPNDIQRYSDSHYQPNTVQDFMSVEQPKNTKFDLSNVNTL